MSADSVWNAYIDEHGEEPANYNQLMSFSKSNKKVKKLSFKEAVNTFNNNHGNGRIQGGYDYYGGDEQQPISPKQPVEDDGFEYIDDDGGHTLYDIVVTSPKSKKSKRNKPAPPPAPKRKTSNKSKPETNEPVLIATNSIKDGQQPTHLMAPSCSAFDGILYHTLISRMCTYNTTMTHRRCWNKQVTEGEERR